MKKLLLLLLLLISVNVSASTLPTGNFLVASSNDGLKTLISSPLDTEMHWDFPNARLGLGTTSPQAHMEIGKSLSGNEAIILANTNTSGATLFSLAETLGTGSTPFVIQRFGSTSGTPRLVLYASEATQNFLVSGNSVLQLQSVGSPTGSVAITSVTGTVANSAASAMYVRADNGTGRSINAGGSVNVAGLDYAEYMPISKKCGRLKSGDIVGIDSNGELTDIFEKAISFAVISTNPGWVGGDHEGVDKGFEKVAFCGQVPVNINKFAIGEFILPYKTMFGKINGISVKNPTYEQYLKSIGKVIKESNGKPTIIVKVI